MAALLTSRPEGATDYIEADFRGPGVILAAAVLLLGVLGHFGDDQEAAELIRRVMAATAPGSYLVIEHGSSTSRELLDAARRYAESGAESCTLRNPEQLARFFDGMDLVPPGLVPVPQGRPDPGSASGMAEV